MDSQLQQSVMQNKKQPTYLTIWGIVIQSRVPGCLGGAAVGLLIKAVKSPRSTQPSIRLG